MQELSDESLHWKRCSPGLVQPMYDTMLHVFI